MTTARRRRRAEDKSRAARKRPVEKEQEHHNARENNLQSVGQSESLKCNGCEMLQFYAVLFAAAAAAVRCMHDEDLRMDI